MKSIFALKTLNRGQRLRVLSNFWKGSEFRRRWSERSREVRRAGEESAYSKKFKCELFARWKQLTGIDRGGAREVLNLDEKRELLRQRCFGAKSV
jgi:hypothetical protein